MDEEEIVITLKRRPAGGWTAEAVIAGEPATYWSTHDDPLAVLSPAAKAVTDHCNRRAMLDRLTVDSLDMGAYDQPSPPTR